MRAVGVAIGFAIALGACASDSDAPDEAASADIELDREVIEYASVEGSAIEADVRMPAGPTRGVVVVLHGGSGSKDDRQYVAFGRLLADAGLTVVVPDLPLADQQTLLGGDVDPVGRAFAAVRCALDLGIELGGDAATSGTVVVGHSAGGLFGGVTGLAGARLARELATTGGADEVECRSPTAAADVDAFVGVNGAHFIFEAFEPGSIDDDVLALLDIESWVASTPRPRVRLVLGDDDASQPPWHQERVVAFADSLGASGFDAELVRLPMGHALPVDGPVADALVELVVEAAETI